MRRREFTVRVGGAFTAPRQWLVHGVIEYGVHLDHTARRRAAAEARIALIGAVRGEVRRGWDAGAVRVQVRVDGDRQASGLFEALDQGTVPAMVS